MASLTLDSGEATNGANKIGLKGTAELPESHPRIRTVRREVRDQRRRCPICNLSPRVLRNRVTGAATVTGTAEIRDAVLRADLAFSGRAGLVWRFGSAAQITGTMKAAKQMPPANERKMYYADLRSQIHVEMTEVPFGRKSFRFGRRPI